MREQNQTPKKQVVGFSEYGLNFLEWDFQEDDFVCEILRSNNGEFFESLSEVNNANYYVDTSAESGTEYVYQIIFQNAVSSEELKSNQVTIMTSESVEEMPDDIAGSVLDLVILESDYESLQIEYGRNDWEGHVSKNVVLQNKGQYGSNISWESSDIQTVTNEGVVTRSIQGDRIVVLTAILSKGGYVLEKEFSLNVIRADQEISDIRVLNWEEIRELNNGELPDVKFYDDGELERIRGKYTDMLIFTANDAKMSINSLKDIIGIKDAMTELELEYESSDEYKTVYFFSQYYKGIPIVGANIVVHVNEDGTPRYLGNSYIKDISVDTVASINEDTLREIVESELEAQEISEARLILYRQEGEGDEVLLCWEVKTCGDSSYQAMIDAQSGVIVYSEQIYKSDVAVEKDIHGEEQTVPVKKKGMLWWKKYYLQDTERNLSVCDGTGTTNYSAMESSKNEWEDEIAITAYNYAIKTYDFFDNLGWKGYDGKNGNMQVVVHYQEYDAAKGEWKYVNNAYSGGSRIKFGDGNGETRRSYASDIDTVAHEFTHCVTDVKLSGLKYSNHAGAIDEAYSDIFGQLVDFSDASGEVTDSKNAWQHGVDIRIGDDEGKASRSLSEPGLYDNPATLYGEDYGVICVDDKHETHENCHDEGHVHNNSTILSHAAYLMCCKGLTYEELAKLWYNSYNFYRNTITPDFYDCRDAVLESAEDLGFSATKIGWVKEAFDEVNIRRSDITVTVLDALNNTVIPHQQIELQSVNKMHCHLHCSCCVDDNCEFLSCDPETCYHSCDEWCEENCELQNRCCNKLTRKVKWTDDEGSVRFSDVVVGYHRIKASALGYEEFYERVYVDESDENIIVLLDPPYESSIEGRITIADEDTNNTNNEPLDFAKVILKKKTGTSELEITTFTGNGGLYKITDIPAGEYELRVEGYNYITVIQTIFIERDQNQFYNVVIESISTEYSGLGYAGGTVIDAFTGEGVKGLTLDVYKDINLSLDFEEGSEKYVETLITDENGMYHTSAIEAGNYTVVVRDDRVLQDEAERYNKTTFIIKILGDTDILSQNGTVSGKLNKNQMRIVLTWGASPRDLDSHLSIKTESGTNGHVYFGNKMFSVGEAECANLDLDDTTGYGPETTTIYTEIDGTFTFYVHNWSGGTSDALSNSGASVSVYTGYATLPFRVYYLPVGNGYDWYVFTYDSVAGTITDINKIQ